MTAGPVRAESAGPADERSTAIDALDAQVSGCDNVVTGAVVPAAPAPPPAVPRPIVRPRHYRLLDEEQTGTRVTPNFDEFYAAHFRGITVQVYAYFGDMAEAQDVSQEAFCRAFSRWHKISGYDDPVAWVRRVAWNLATSRWRRMRTALNFARKYREEHAPAPGPDHVALTAALATLPERQRRAVVLHYLADLPIAEIALQESVAEGTVKSWLHRARAALAQQLSDDQPTEDGEEVRDA